MTNTKTMQELFLAEVDGSYWEISFSNPRSVGKESIYDQGIAIEEGLRQGQIDENQLMRYIAHTVSRKYSHAGETLAFAFLDYRKNPSDKNQESLLHAMIHSNYNYERSKFSGDTKSSLYAKEYLELLFGKRVAHKIIEDIVGRKVEEIYKAPEDGITTNNLSHYTLVFFEMNRLLGWSGKDILAWLEEPDEGDKKKTRRERIKDQEYYYHSRLKNQMKEIEKKPI